MLKRHFAPTWFQYGFSAEDAIAPSLAESLDHAVQGGITGKYNTNNSEVSIFA
jgi:hypothetical protein